LIKKPILPTNVSLDVHRKGVYMLTSKDRSRSALLTPVRSITLATRHQQMTSRHFLVARKLPWFSWH